MRSVIPPFGEYQPGYALGKEGESGTEAIYLDGCSPLEEAMMPEVLKCELGKGFLLILEMTVFNLGTEVRRAATMLVSTNKTRKTEEK